MKEDKGSQTTDIDKLMPTEEEQHELRMAMGRASRPEPDVEAELEKFAAAHMERQPAMPWVRPLLWLSAAVAVVMLILLVTKPFSDEKRQEAFVAVENIKREVTIKTDDSEPVVVTQKQLDFRHVAHNTAPDKTAETRKTTIATSRGMDFGLTLPDGTEVWLNAESRITFPDEFSSGQREVEIDGEAFFDVKKDADRPFIVHTKYFTTKVLGTSFDVKAYREETAHVVLVSGKVEVTAGVGGTKTMAPGEMVAFDNDCKLRKTSVDTYPYVQWKDGFFYFEKAPLGDIMRELGRWYNINIVFENTKKMDVRMQFVAEKTQSINEIVKSLNSLGGAKLTLGDNEITIE